MAESLSKIIDGLKLRKHNVRFKDLQKFLTQNGFIERHSKSGTSHRIYSHPKLILNVVLVTHGKNDILPSYQVSEAIKALEELEELFS